MGEGFPGATCGSGSATATRDGVRKKARPVEGPPSAKGTRSGFLRNLNCRRERLIVLSVPKVLMHDLMHCPFHVLGFDLVSVRLLAVTHRSDVFRGWFHHSHHPYAPHSGTESIDPCALCISLTSAFAGQNESASGQNVCYPEASDLLTIVFDQPDHSPRGGHGNRHRRCTLECKARE